MMKNLTIVLLSFVLLANKTFSQKIVPTPYYKMTNFDTSPYKSFKHAGGTTFFRMPFRLLFPKGYDSTSADTKKYPMIIMLHGYGESAQGRAGYNTNVPYSSTDPRLNNNDYQLWHHGQEYLNAVNSGEWPGFVMFPQNVDGTWTEPLLDDVSTIVKSLCTTLKIDPNRIHVSGLSSGGQGVCDILKKHPNLFACGVSYSGIRPAAELDIQKTVHIPFWYFQGGKDLHPAPSLSGATFQAMKNIGGTPVYTLYPDTDHGTWYQAIKEPDFFPFLLRNSKLSIHAYFGKTTFEPGEAINARLGITGGFEAYEWRKDGEIIPGASSNEIFATSGGSYTVRFKRANSDWTVWSDPLIIKTNTPPTVNITSPANNATFVAGSNITISASAFDADGPIRKVEFFIGTVKLGEDSIAPYSIVWSNASIGSYSFTAKATDKSGLTAISPAVSITVEPINIAPTASITSPVNNASFIAGLSVTIDATAADVDGTVTKVEFFQGIVKLGEDVSAPYSLIWTNVAVGSYSLTVKATDDDGASHVSSEVKIAVTSPITCLEPAWSFSTVYKTGKRVSYKGIIYEAKSKNQGSAPDKNSGPKGDWKLIGQCGSINQAPVVSITSPENDASFTAPAQIIINVSATDADGSIAKVEFFEGGVKLGEDLTAPYSFTWSHVAKGTYSLTAKATDNKGASTTSSAISLTVKKHETPSVAIYPNRCTNGSNIHLEFDHEYKNVQVQFKAVNSCKVSSYTYHNVKSIDLILPSLPKGVNFIEIQADKNKWIERLFVY